MTHLLSNRWKLFTLILLPLLVSLACSTLTGGPEANSEEQLVLGPGTYISGDMKAGLAELSGYKATLIMSFDGTRDNQPSRWSKTYVMLTTKEPAARQLTLEKTGDLPSLDQIIMAEADGAAYERRGENACNANVIDPGNSLAEQWEPASFLAGVVGAEEAATETVNDVAADHYTFDERALGQQGLAQSTGGIWVASEGGYIVKYVLTTRGDASYFGEGIEGTLSWDYELTDVNGQVTLTLPADCPAGMVDAPQLPDASNVLNMPGMLSYDTASSLTDAAAFYQKQIPDLGWKSQGDAAVTDTSAQMEFTQGDQTMTVIIIVGDTGTNVQVLLGKAQQ